MGRWDTGRSKFTLNILGGRNYALLHKSISINKDSTLNLDNIYKSNHGNKMIELAKGYKNDTIQESFKNLLSRDAEIIKRHNELMSKLKFSIIDNAETKNHCILCGSNIKMREKCAYFEFNHNSMCMDCHELYNPKMILHNYIDYRNNIIKAINYNDNKLDTILEYHIHSKNVIEGFSPKHGTGETGLINISQYIHRLTTYTSTIASLKIDINKSDIINDPLENEIIITLKLLSRVDIPNNNLLVTVQDGTTDDRGKIAKSLLEVIENRGALSNDICEFIGGKIRNLIFTGDQDQEILGDKITYKIKRDNPFNLNKTDIDESNKSNILNRLNESDYYHDILCDSTLSDVEMRKILHWNNESCGIKEVQDICTEPHITHVERTDETIPSSAKHTWNTWVYDNDLSMFSRYCLPDETVNEIIVLKTRILHNIDYIFGKEMRMHADSTITYEGIIEDYKDIGKSRWRDIGPGLTRTSNGTTYTYEQFIIHYQKLGAKSWRELNTRYSDRLDTRHVRNTEEESVLVEEIFKLLGDDIFKFKRIVEGNKSAVASDLNDKLIEAMQPPGSEETPLNLESQIVGSRSKTQLTESAINTQLAKIKNYIELFSIDILKMIEISNFGGLVDGFNNNLIKFIYIKFKKLYNLISYNIKGAEADLHDINIKNGILYNTQLAWTSSNPNFSWKPNENHTISGKNIIPGNNIRYDTLYVLSIIDKFYAPLFYSLNINGGPNEGPNMIPDAVSKMFLPKAVYYKHDNSRLPKTDWYDKYVKHRVEFVADLSNVKYLITWNKDIEKNIYNHWYLYDNHYNNYIDTNGKTKTSIYDSSRGVDFERTKLLSPRERGVSALNRTSSGSGDKVKTILNGASITTSSRPTNTFLSGGAASDAVSDAASYAASYAASRGAQRARMTTLAHDAQIGTAIWENNQKRTIASIQPKLDSLYFFLTNEAYDNTTQFLTTYDNNNKIINENCDNDLNTSKNRHDYTNNFMEALINGIFMNHCSFENDVEELKTQLLNKTTCASIIEGDGDERLKDIFAIDDTEEESLDYIKNILRIVNNIPEGEKAAGAAADVAKFTNLDDINDIDHITHDKSGIKLKGHIIDTLFSLYNYKVNIVLDPSVEAVNDVLINILKVYRNITFGCFKDDESFMYTELLAGSGFPPGGDTSRTGILYTVIADHKSYNDSVKILHGDTINVDKNTLPPDVIYLLTEWVSYTLRRIIFTLIYKINMVSI